MEPDTADSLNECRQAGWGWRPPHGRIRQGSHIPPPPSNSSEEVLAGAAALARLGVSFSARGVSELVMPDAARGVWSVSRLGFIYSLQTFVRGSKGRGIKVAGPAVWGRIPIG